MGKNSTGKKLILSISELSPALQLFIHKVSIFSGIVAFVIYAIIAFVFEAIPNDDWLILFSFCCAFILVFVNAARFLVLSHFGYVLPQQQASANARNQDFHSYDNSSHTSMHSYSSHTSINPSSGSSMCGSSGIDTSGNPYGTNSW